MCAAVAIHSRWYMYSAKDQTWVASAAMINSGVNVLSAWPLVRAPLKTLPGESVCMHQ